MRVLIDRFVFYDFSLQGLTSQVYSLSLMATLLLRITMVNISGTILFLAFLILILRFAGFITVYSVDADGAYFVRMEFEAHNKGISCLVMLSEGTLLSGGERDRKIVAWDSLQNYKKITEIKVDMS